MSLANKVTERELCWWNRVLLYVSTTDNKGTDGQYLKK